MNRKRERKREGEKGINGQPSYQSGKILLFALLVSVVSLSGCMGTRTHVIEISPSAGMMKSAHYRVVGQSEGQSSSFDLFWIIPVTPRINYNEAVDEAISKVGGDNLINVKSWVKNEYWIVGRVRVLTVRGTVILYDEKKEEQGLPD